MVRPPLLVPSVRSDICADLKNLIRLIPVLPSRDAPTKAGRYNIGALCNTGIATNAFILSPCTSAVERFRAQCALPLTLAVGNRSVAPGTRSGKAARCTTSNIGNFGNTGSRQPRSCYRYYE